MTKYSYSHIIILIPTKQTETIFFAFSFHLFYFVHHEYAISLCRTECECIDRTRQGDKNSTCWVFCLIFLILHYISTEETISLINVAGLCLFWKRPLGN